MGEHTDTYLQGCYRYRQARARLLETMEALDEARQDCAGNHADGDCDPERCAACGAECDVTAAEKRFDQAGDELELAVVSGLMALRPTRRGERLRAWVESDRTSRVLERIYTAKLGSAVFYAHNIAYLRAGGHCCTCRSEVPVRRECESCEEYQEHVNRALARSALRAVAPHRAPAVAAHDDAHLVAADKKGAA